MARLLGLLSLGCLVWAATSTPAEAHHGFGGLLGGWGGYQYGWHGYDYGHGGYSHGWAGYGGGHHGCGCHHGCGVSDWYCGDCSGHIGYFPSPGCCHGEPTDAHQDGLEPAPEAPEVVKPEMIPSPDVTSQLRTWRNRDGEVLGRGRAFVVTEDRIAISKENGWTATLEVANLSLADLDYLAQRHGDKLHLVVQDAKRGKVARQ